MDKSHVVSVEVIEAALDEEAIAKAETMFCAKEGRFTGFELWDLARVVYRHPS